MEADWTEGKRDFNNMITGAGFRMVQTQRMGFDGHDAPQWIKQGPSFNQYFSNSHAELQAEGGDMDSL